MVIPKQTTVRHWSTSAWMLRPVVALLGALVLTTLILLGSGTDPVAVYRVILFGAFSSPAKIGDMVALAAPLLLCAAGLTITFAAGMYNLGIEGQMGMGAVCAMLVGRLFDTSPPSMVWVGALLAGALGGALWAALAGLLKLYGRVSEIFAGLGLNFLTTGVALYLVFGPWKRPGTASMSGTEPLPNALWLPTVGGLRLVPFAPILALLAVGVVWFILARSRWGLSVRAVGRNINAAERLGTPAGRRLIESLAACGALAGVAGALQVFAVFHTLIPNISSGIGLLALLVVLLVDSRPAWVLPISLLFAIFTVGSTQLPLTLQVDSSISGVFQGALVLWALAMRYVRKRA